MPDSAASPDSARPRTPVPDSLLGRVIDGRYRITELMARGGMGSVYVAQDERLDRPVAIKVIHSHLAESPQYSARFRREARAAARISHPGVVPVFDQGTVDGRGYLVMELVDGVDLRSYLYRHQPYSLSLVLELTQQILLGVQAAHQVEVVHRDLKPENVLVTRNRQVKVADFGLSRSGSDPALSSTGSLFGTVSYLAPEVALGDRADTRADVFAVGVMLYEMLTGRLPATGETAVQIAYRRVNEDTPLPSLQVEWLPTEIDELSTCLCARDPQERPANAGEAARLVQRVRDTLPAELAERDLPPLQSFTPESTTVSSDPQRTILLAPVPLALTAEMELTPQMVHTAGSGASETVSTPEPTSRRKLFMVALTLLLVAASCVGIWWWWIQYGPGAYREVPDLAGMTEAQVVQELRELQLASVVETEFSDDVEVGLVTRTNPEAGGSVHKNAEITVYISAGVEMLDVPTELVGLSQENAETAIEAAGLQVGEITETYSTEVDAGLVISVDPEEGETVRHDTPVNLTVSLGPKPVTVPNVVGSSRTDAESALEELGLTVNVTEQYSNEVAAGNVISQSEDADTTLHEGDSIDLVVSLGPEYVEVPSVFGKQLEEATQILEDAGFQVEVNQLASFFNTVGSQSPAAGERARRGSTVTITVV